VPCAPVTIRPGNDQPDDGRIVVLRRHDDKEVNQSILKQLIEKKLLGLPPLSDKLTVGTARRLLEKIAKK